MEYAVNDPANPPTRIRSDSSVSASSLKKRNSVVKETSHISSHLRPGEFMAEKVQIVRVEDGDSSEGELSDSEEHGPHGHSPTLQKKSSRTKKVKHAITDAFRSVLGKEKKDHSEDLVSHNRHETGNPEDLNNTAVMEKENANKFSGHDYQVQHNLQSAFATEGQKAVREDANSTTTQNRYEVPGEYTLLPATDKKSERHMDLGKMMDLLDHQEPKSSKTSHSSHRGVASEYAFAAPCALPVLEDKPQGPMVLREMMEAVEHPGSKYTKKPQFSQGALDGMFHGSPTSEDSGEAHSRRKDSGIVEADNISSSSGLVEDLRRRDTGDSGVDLIQHRRVHVYSSNESEPSYQYAEISQRDPEPISSGKLESLPIRPVRSGEPVKLLKSSEEWKGRDIPKDSHPFVEEKTLVRDVAESGMKFSKQFETVGSHVEELPVDLPVINLKRTEFAEEKVDIDPNVGVKGFRDRLNLAKGHWQTPMQIAQAEIDATKVAFDGLEQNVQPNSQDKVYDFASYKERGPQETRDGLPETQTHVHEVVEEMQSDEHLPNIHVRSTKSETRFAEKSKEPETKTVVRSASKNKKPDDNVVDSGLKGEHVYSAAAEAFKNGGVSSTNPTDLVQPKIESTTKVCDGVLLQSSPGPLTSSTTSDLGVLTDLDAIVSADEAEDEAAPHESAWEKFVDIVRYIFWYIFALLTGAHKDMIANEPHLEKPEVTTEKETKEEEKPENPPEKLVFHGEFSS